MENYYRRERRLLRFWMFTVSPSSLILKVVIKSKVEKNVDKRNIYFPFIFLRVFLVTLSSQESPLLFLDEFQEGLYCEMKDRCWV